MKRLLSTIGACVLCTAASLQAQELPLRTQRTVSGLCSRPLQLVVPAPEFALSDTLSWQLEHIRRRIMRQERRREVTDRNVAPVRRIVDQERKVATNWLIHLGNTGSGNWSPFSRPGARRPGDPLSDGPLGRRSVAREAEQRTGGPQVQLTNKNNKTTKYEMAEKVQVNADKLKVLNAVMEKIEKDFGKGSIMRMNSTEVNDIPVIPTGSITLDMALGVGGYPKGRVIEIYGPESSGKTTLAIHAIAEAQKSGGIAAFIDAEHAFDSFYAQKLGVDVDNLLISQPDNGEQALEIADSLIRSSAIDIIVIDSVAALTPKAEIEGEMGDSKMGLQARLMSQALRKLTSSISKTKTVCIFINQLRDKIGVVYGNPETTTGGNALKFYASVRIDIRRVSVIKDGEEQLGTRTRVKVVKNKVAPPFKKAEFDIMFGEGISKVGEIIDLGVDYGIIKKAGSWFSYGDSKIGQGRDAVKERLTNDENLRNEVEEKVREAMKQPRE